MRTASSFTIHVVSQAGTAELDSLFKNQRYRLEEALLLSTRQLVGWGQRMYPRLEKSLIRINVANPCHERLIQKQGLD